MVATKYNKCVARKLRGKHYRTKTGQIKALKSAARACKKFKKKGTAKRKKRIRHRQSSIPRYRKCVQACQRKIGHSRGPYLEKDRQTALEDRDGRNYRERFLGPPSFEDMWD
jgi:hypothetical protein